MSRSSPSRIAQAPDPCRGGAALQPVGNPDGLVYRVGLLQEADQRLGVVQPSCNSSKSRASWWKLTWNASAALNRVIKSGSPMPCGDDWRGGGSRHGSTSPTRAAWRSPATCARPRPLTVIPPPTVIPPLPSSPPYHHPPSYRHSGVGRNPEAPQRRIPPLPIRGEDAANAAGEGTGVGARRAPPYRHPRESAPLPSLPSAPCAVAPPTPILAPMTNPQASGGHAQRPQRGRSIQPHSSPKLPHFSPKTPHRRLISSPALGVNGAE